MAHKHIEEKQQFIFFSFSGKASSFEESDGTGTGRNEVRIRLSRGDLGSQFICRAENEAVEQPLQTSVQIDVNRKSFFISHLFNKHTVCFTDLGKLNLPMVVRF